MKSVYLGRKDLLSAVYPAPVQKHLATLTESISLGDSLDNLAPETLEYLREVEVIFSTWGMPLMSPSFLDCFPKLRAVFYAAGSVKGFATPETYDRGIRISSAWGANAIPVAEFTVAAITLSLKQFWASAASSRLQRTYHRPLPIPGMFHSTVGLVSLGMIGRLVAERLKQFELRVLAFDPFVKPEAPVELRLELTGLSEIFQHSDVVSIHTPWLKETENLIGGELIASMKHGATFINTSRGAVVHEAELVEVARERPDLTFLLDVTYPEPPPSDSPIYDLPNIILTPHIAGSAGGEVARMGEWMAEEFDRFRQNQPLRHEVTRSMLATMA